MNNKNLSLSVVISVFNGEQILDDCLKSVSFAKEIVVVNNSSADKTLEIAKKYTDKIFTRPNNPMLNVNKNFGFSKATEEWILCLDADERVTPELRDEIKNQISNLKNEINGFWIPRKNIIFGKWIEHTGWYPDHQLRLFRKNRGKFPEKHVHEMIKVEGKVEYLKNDLLHHSYSTIFQFVNKFNIYVVNEAGQLIEEGYKFKWQDTIHFPVKEFLSRFFAREGYKDGLHGLILSMLMAFYHLLIVAVVWEKLGFEKINRNNFNDEINSEVKKSFGDFSSWIRNEKIKTINNPFKKIIYKIFSKIRSR